MYKLILFLGILFLLSSKAPDNPSHLSKADKYKINEIIVDYWNNSFKNDSAKFSDFEIMLSDEIINAHEDFINVLMSDRSISKKYDTSRLREVLSTFKKNYDNITIIDPEILHNKKSNTNYLDKLMMFYSKGFEGYFTVITYTTSERMEYRMLDEWNFNSTILIKEICPHKFQIIDGSFGIMR